jgi:hypothetical protein
VATVAPLTCPADGGRWPEQVVITSSVAALVLCLLVVLSGSMDVVAVWWWQFIRVAGFLGFWLACIGVVLGLAVLFTAIRRHAPKWRVLAAIGFCGAALIVTGIGVWWVHVPPYWLRLHELREPPSAWLNTLGPEAVVRTYFTSQDLSVEYRLEDRTGRAFFSDPNAVPDLSLLAGVGTLQITALHGGSRGDTTHRSFSVAYTSRAPNGTGESPGAQQVLVNLARRPGGPWRVSYVGDGM